MRSSAIGGVALLCALFCATAVSAQDTRAATLEHQREEKARQLQPYKPGRLEKALLTIDAENPLAKIAPYNGFFVEYGYSHKPMGSGIGVGGGFRHDLFDRHARVELEAGISYRNYRLFRADFSLPYLARNRFEVGVEATQHHHPQEDFFGLGPASLREDRVSYLLDTMQVEGRGIARPFRGLEIGTRIGRLDPSLGRGTDTLFPSIELRFDDRAAPGLDAQPAFGYTDVFAAFDYRDARGNARSGGYYTIAWRRVSDLDLGRYSFRSIDARAQQFIPIFDKKRVFALQARLMTTDTAEHQRVPFYWKPTVGGGHSVRSVRDFRFRDDNAMFFNVEYRWEAFSPLDMALFADWGTVAPTRGDLRFSDLTRGYGIGFRFNTAKAVFFRADIATGGGEGVRYLLKFSKMF